MATNLPVRPATDVVPVVLVSGQTVALALARALGTRHVPVIVVEHGQQGFARWSRWVNGHAHAPDPVHDEDGFVRSLLALSDQYGHALLVPTTDESLVAISRNKRRLEASYVVACPDWEVTRRCIDKGLTHELAERHGIPLPRSVSPHSLSELRTHAGDLRLPCLVKPRESHRFFEHFGRKMVPVTSRAQMEAVYLAASDLGLEVMIQEIIPGDDRHVFNYNAYAWEGQALVEFTAEHLRNGPPFWGSPRVVRSRHVPELLGPGRAMLAALGFSGFACTEFKFDARDGLFKLMEVNARHNLSTALAPRCGIDFPWLEYRHRIHHETPRPQAFRSGVTWVDLVRDAAFSVSHRASERYSLQEYLAPYRGRRVFAVWDRQDPLPLVVRLLSAAARGLSGTASRPGLQQMPAESDEILQAVRIGVASSGDPLAVTCSDDELLHRREDAGDELGATPPDAANV